MAMPTLSPRNPGFLAPHSGWRHALASCGRKIGANCASIVLFACSGLYTAASSAQQTAAPLPHVRLSAVQIRQLIETRPVWCLKRRPQSQVCDKVARLNVAADGRGQMHLTALENLPRQDGNTWAMLKKRVGFTIWLDGDTLCMPPVEKRSTAPEWYEAGDDAARIGPGDRRLTPALRAEMFRQAGQMRYRQAAQDLQATCVAILKVGGALPHYVAERITDEIRGTAKYGEKWARFVAVDLEDGLRLPGS